MQERRRDKTVVEGGRILIAETSTSQPVFGILWKASIGLDCRGISVVAVDSITERFPQTVIVFSLKVPHIRVVERDNHQQGKDCTSAHKPLDGKTLSCHRAYCRVFDDDDGRKVCGMKSLGCWLLSCAFQNSKSSHEHSQVTNKLAVYEVYLIRLHESLRCNEITVNCTAWVLQYNSMTISF